MPQLLRGLHRPGQPAVLQPPSNPLSFGSPGRPATLLALAELDYGGLAAVVVLLYDEAALRLQKSRWFRVWNPGPSLASSCRGCFEGIVPDLSAPGGSEPAVRGNAESSTPPSCSRSHTPLRPLSLPCSSAGIRTVPSPGAQSELCESDFASINTADTTRVWTPLPCIHLFEVDTAAEIRTAGVQHHAVHLRAQPADGRG